MTARRIGRLEPSSNPSSTSRLFRPRFLAQLTDAELNFRLATFQESFVVARECIDELLDTPKDDEYYQDNTAFAQDAVQSAVEEFNSILGELDGTEKQRLLRSHGLKVKQLEGELELALQGGYDTDTKS